jgi:cytochrome c553
MQPMAEQLSNEDVRNLGAYFASLPPPKASAPKNLRAHKNRINGVHISHEPYQMQFGLVEINF